MKQKAIFLKSEGNAWFERNAQFIEPSKFPESDSLLVEILGLGLPSGATQILEVGCGEGARLGWLKDNCGFECYGVDPSAKAVEAAKGKGIEASQGTADQLPFDDQSFDIVIFGFCLYLCDREDLFRIACEADRVLKNPGWVAILDFYSEAPFKREYHHHLDIFSYKMDYRKLFMWNPGYTNYSQKLSHHLDGGYTDDPQEWVATSVLRKNLESNE